MMDVSEFAESEWVNAEVANGAKVKIAVIVGPAEVKLNEADKTSKLVVPVEVDAKRKKWQMNRATVKNMLALSVDSNDWIGHKVQLVVNGKQVIGTPIL